MNSEVIFTTPQLHVRKLVAKDLPDFHTLQANPKVMRFVGGKVMTLEENRSDLVKVQSAYEQTNNTFWIWAITTLQQIFVGTCALLINDKQEWEIGYRFIEEYWGKGYGKEITKGLIDHAFGAMDIETLVAYVDEKNVGSVKILDRYFNYVSTEWNEAEQCQERKCELHKASVKST